MAEHSRICSDPLDTTIQYPSMKGKHDVLRAAQYHTDTGSIGITAQ